MHWLIYRLIYCYDINSNTNVTYFSTHKPLATGKNVQHNNVKFYIISVKINVFIYSLSYLYNHGMVTRRW